MRRVSEKKAKQLKQEILTLLNSPEYKNWTILFSQKSMTEGVNIYGECDPEKKVITINPKKGNLVTIIITIIHELLHALHPDASERTVRYSWERAVYESFSPLETTALLAAVFGSAIWNE